MSFLAALGIGALVGASMGSGSYFLNLYKNNNALEKAKDRLAEARDRNVAYMNQQFAYNQNEAIKSADKADRQSTLQEALLGTSVNNSIASLASSQKANTLNYNLAAISAGQTEGSSLASIAGGGTRGSSSVHGASMEASLNNQTLQATQDSDRLNSDISLASVLGEQAESAFAIQSNRTSAKDTRTSWSEGGEAYELFQTQRANYIADVNSQIDALSDQQHYWSLDQLTSASGWSEIGSNLLDLGYAALQGAVTGAQFGASAYSYSQMASSATSAASTASTAASTTIDTSTPLLSDAYYDVTFGSTSAFKPYNYNSISFGNLSPSYINLKL